MVDALSALAAAVKEKLNPAELLENAIDEVHTRFILNLPDSELLRADRILFQIEQAWWFYEDFLVDQSGDDGVGNGDIKYNDASSNRLPSFTFYQFAQQLFKYSPLLDSRSFPQMLAEFNAYKKKIGTYGCILLSEDYKSVVLVQIWNSRTHTFPSGKINQGEEATAAAIRETYEETGFDVSCRHGLTAQWKDLSPERITWITSLEDAQAFSFREDCGKNRTCYVVHGVPLDFPFEAVARKEVSKIAFFPLDSIPKPNFAVLPYYSQLKKWIAQRHENEMTASRSNSGLTTTTKKKNANSNSTPNRDRSNTHSERSSSSLRNSTKSRSNATTATTPLKFDSGSGTTTSRSRARNSARTTRDRRDSVTGADDAFVFAGLVTGGETAGWSEDEMFAANEKLLGRKINYDGNPHLFTDKCWGEGQDPHAFHIVGGALMNSSGITNLIPTPSSSLLQPLFQCTSVKNIGSERKLEGNVGCKELTPFFTSHDEVAAFPSDGHTVQLSFKSISKFNNMITSASVVASSTTANDNDSDPSMSEVSRRDYWWARYHADRECTRAWVANLPKPQPTSLFGKPFRLDADRIMQKLLNLDTVR